MMVWLYWIVGLWILYKVLDKVSRVPRYKSPKGRIKYILITGCDTGFGNLLAKRLDSRGFYVFAACLKEKCREELQKTSSSRLQTFVMDVAKTTSVTQGYDFVKQYIPEDSGLWAVVNNAGITGNKIGPSEWLSRDDYLDVMNTNFFGMINVTKAFLPLVKKCRGRIVNTTSIVGRFVLPASGPYSCSKYAAEAYSDCLRRELLPFGVSVHIIEPGFYLTNITDPHTLTQHVQRTWDSLPLATKEEYGESYLQAAISVVEDSLPRFISKRVHRVVSTYEHAVLARRPKYRYMVGSTARFVFHPLSLMPEWLSDGLLYWSRQIPKPACCETKA